MRDEVTNSDDEAAASRDRPSDGLWCDGCSRSVRLMLELLRPPVPPEEIRACDKCAPILVAEGGEVMFTCVPPQMPQHEFTCGRCLDGSNSFRIVSKTGRPVTLKRCEDCYSPLRLQGWRACSAHGLA